MSGIKAFYLTLVILLSCTPFTSSAAQSSKISRIGYLSNLSREYEYTRIESFERGLRELGYIEGQNIVIEDRYANGKVDEVTRFAAELVKLNVDVIVTGGGTPTREAQK